MKPFFLFGTGALLLLSGCKSAGSSCNRCPYESQVAPERVEQPAVCYLAAASCGVNIDNILPTNPFSVCSLARYAAHTLSLLHQNIIDKAFDYEGVRYRRGGTSPQGMDCSGLVYTCFRAYGIMLPRSSADMAASVNNISRHEAMAGDLVFFKTSRRNRVNHVGLVIEARNGEIKFIHASVHNGVIVSSTSEDYYARTFVKVGRVARV
ncbi:MAG: C40 family peptidase [Prevotella sp.]|nr:C40 family peptidase [Prevotella sp.]